MRQEGKENGQREFKHLWYSTNAILGEGHAQVLLDGIDEHLISSEDWPSVLEDGEEKL